MLSVPEEVKVVGFADDQTTQQIEGGLRNGDSESGKALAGKGRVHPND